ncbi:helix-turn-helix domain-containing protein (plasmid) [Streptomyces sp. QH1-20]|uniref:helix-turn-helix domain-containing protein n=1 Tax=Streptomyces sp. QH1-20 TaxID=3240934 RepID=UPI003511B806
MAPSTGSGRPRKYCSDECRKSFYRATSTASPEAERHDGYVQQILDELSQKVDRLRNLAHADRTELTELTEPDYLRVLSLALLQKSAEVAKDLQDLDAALAQQARDRGVKVSDIASTRSVSVDKVSRDWPADSIDRRMNQRRQRTRQHPSGLTGIPGLPEAGFFLPAHHRAADPDIPQYGDDSTEGPPGKGDGATLARALSHLQRSCNKSLRALGAEAGVSGSYVSRVLSGERRPSWKIARKLVTACDGDPAEIRRLWEVARGRVTSAPEEPGAFHAALRGLYLSAACPDPATLHLSSHGLLSLGEITAALRGHRVPEWTTVDRLVHALHSKPSTIRPLWDNARCTQPPDRTHLTPGRGIPCSTAASA